MNGSVKAWRGGASSGTARHDLARRDAAGVARLGVARLGQAAQGMAGRGRAGRGRVLFAERGREMNAEVFCQKRGIGFEPLAANIAELQGMIGVFKAEIAKVTG